MLGVFCLLLAFQLKHFLADYPLQGRWMLDKSRPGWNFIGPLTAHAGVHAAMTFAIVQCFTARPWSALLLASVDFLAHFAVDRVKASPRLLGRWKSDQPQFWWALGGDQMAHHLTHYAIIWALVY